MHFRRGPIENLTHNLNINAEYICFRMCECLLNVVTITGKQIWLVQVCKTRYTAMAKPYGGWWV